MKNFFLFLVAIIITTFVGVLSLIFTPIYYIATFKWKSGLNRLSEWFLKLAISVDQFGNVVCASTFKVIMTHPFGHNFGDEDDTVSYVLGRNKHKGKLTKVGNSIVWVLNKIEENHTDIAIHKKKEKDLQAYRRILEDKYFN